MNTSPSNICQKAVSACKLQNFETIPRCLPEGEPSSLESLKTCLHSNLPLSCDLVQPQQSPYALLEYLLFSSSVCFAARTTAQLHKGLHKELNNVLLTCQPRKTLMLAMDGPAPLAKLLTQRYSQHVQTPPCLGCLSKNLNLFVRSLCEEIGASYCQNGSADSLVSLCIVIMTWSRG